MNKVKLSNYTSSWHATGGVLKKILWYFTNIIFFKTSLPFPSSFRVMILKLYGAKIGKKVVIKPVVNIKYPWFLKVGDYCWIGEDVWIDNLTTVKLLDNVVLSQGSYLLTGSHDYKKEAFDIILGEIILEDGVWIGAKATVCPGVICRSHSVLSVGSVATKELKPYRIYQGNPALDKRERIIV